MIYLLSAWGLALPTEQPKSADLLILPNESNIEALAKLKTEPTATEQLNIVYNSRDDSEVKIDSEKEALLNRLREGIGQHQPTDEVIIPEAPTDISGYEKIAALSEADMQIFLSKKTRFLQKFAKALSFFKIKPRFINKALIELNQHFYDSTHLIAKSNAIGGSVMLSVSGGLALPQKISNFLKNRSIGRFIPESGGFYYLLGIGIGITHTVDEVTKKPSWVLESYVDTESLKKSISGIVEVSLAGTYGVIYEHREGSFQSQQVETTYGGLTGLFKKGKNQFGWSASSGISLPPGIGAILIFTDNTTRRYFVRLNISKYIFEPALKIFSIFLASKKASAGLRCAEVLAPIF